MNKPRFTTPSWRDLPLIIATALTLIVAVDLNLGGEANTPTRYGLFGGLVITASIFFLNWRLHSQMPYGFVVYGLIWTTLLMYTSELLTHLETVTDLSPPARIALFLTSSFLLQNVLYTIAFAVRCQIYRDKRLLYEAFAKIELARRRIAILDRRITVDRERQTLSRFCGIDNETNHLN